MAIPSTDALNVTENHEQWLPDEVSLWVEPCDDQRILLLAALLLGPALAPGLLGAALSAVFGVGPPWLALAVLLLGPMMLCLATVLALRMSRTDIPLVLSRSQLVVGDCVFALDELSDVRWEGSGLCVEDRSGARHLSRPLRPRDPARVLRILRSALPTEAEREEHQRREREATEKLAAVWVQTPPRWGRTFTLT